MEKKINYCETKKKSTTPKVTNTKNQVTTQHQEDKFKVTELFNAVIDAIKHNSMKESRIVVKNEVSKIAEMFELSEDKAFLLPILFNYSNFKKLEQQTKCNCVDLLYYAQDLKELDFENIIKFNSKELVWPIDTNTITDVLRHEKLRRTDYKTISARQICSLTWEKMFEKHSGKDDFLIYLSNKLITAGNNLISPFMKKRKTQDTLLFWVSLYVVMITYASKFGNSFTKKLLKQNMNQYLEKDNIIEGAYDAFLKIAQKEGIITANDNGETYKVNTDYAKQIEIDLDDDDEYFEDPFDFDPFEPTQMGSNENMEEKNAGPVYKIIVPESVTAKQLYYNDEEIEEITKLNKLFMPENMARVQEKLKKMDRTGIVTLLYGAPGTGKTETCIQLSRITGRELYVVDASSIKHKWMGQSERNLRKLFADYSAAVEKNKKENKPFPIMLLNEADGLISKRVNVEENSDQVLNALQNIFLQELEMTKGIIICTTNLTQNFDSAFERRFLYKVEFHSPRENVRALIWKDKLEFLTKKECEQLAHEFNFSGGEIENVARKILVDSIVDEDVENIEHVISLCQREKIKKNTNRAKVGFC